MKKMMAIILAVMMCLSVVPAFADAVTGEKMEQMILSAKSKIYVDDEKFVIDSCRERQDQKSGVMLYDISWKTRDEAQKGSLNVTIDAEGNIWEYDVFIPYANVDKPLPDGKWEEAKSAARAFMEQVNPIIFAETEFEEIIYNGRMSKYRITYRRVHNGIPTDNRVHMYVSEADMSVDYFYASWNMNATFEEGDMISPETAKDIYKEKLGYRLYYYEKGLYDDKESEVILIYNKKSENLYIHALTGSLESYREERKNMLSDSNASSGGMLGAGMTTEEIAYVQEVEKLISVSDAEKTARSIKEFGITEEMQLAHYNLSEYKKAFTYELVFATNDKNIQASVMVDAETGEISQYDKWRFDVREETKMTPEEQAVMQEQSKKDAEAFLRTYYPERAEYTELSYEKEGFLRYSRVENGIPFENKGFWFTYSDGEFTRFTADWACKDAPMPENVKSLDEAYDVILSEGNFKLMYIPTYPQEKTCVMRAVYYLENDNPYSAKNLHPLTYSMEEVAEKQPVRYTDLSGHYAESAITALGEIDVYLGEQDETLFRPEEAVTQADFLEILSSVMHWSYDLDYSYLVSEGVLTKEEVSPDKPLTRMEGIRYIVRMLSGAMLAEQPELFVSVYNDVPEADKGYATMAAGYGLVNSTVSELYPQNPLRRADAMIIIHNLLTKVNPNIY